MTDILNALIIIANFIIVPGLAYGSQLALGALGVSLVFSVLRFSNIAHGETMAAGAMFTILFTWWLQSLGVGFGPLPTALLALPFGVLSTVVLCLATDRTVYAYYRRVKASPAIYIIVSVGVMFVYNGLIRFVIGPGDRLIGDGQRFILKARDFKNATGLNEGLAIKTSQAVSVFSAIVAVAVLFWFLNRTRTGKSMRAFSNNEDLALLSGINPERVVLVAWLITAALATLAGTLYGIDKSFRPFVYMQLLLPIFAAAIVGGFGSPLGAIAGGFIIAFSELFVTFAYKRVLAYLLPDSMAPTTLVQLLSTDYKIAVSFGILVIVLLIKPTGLFSQRTA
jgi:branched-chain amino acid transport system permease protein